MAKLQESVRRNLTPILLLLLAGGFLVVLGELVIYRHWDGVQLIGFVATVIGFVGVLLGLFVKGGLRVGVAILLAVISVSGLIGAYEHYEGRAESGEAMQPVPVQVSSGANFTVAYNPSAVEASPQQESGETGENGESGEGGAAAQGTPAEQNGERGEGGGGGGETPPPLAPLSIAGLALMGAAVLLAKQD